ncbi:argF, partial [Symbiodinium pilosum]
LFQRYAQRYADFRERILYLDMDRCPRYQKRVEESRAQHAISGGNNTYRIEHAQRHCLWELLQQERPDLSDEALMIFTDLDEIPNAEVMLALKSCQPSDR